MSQDKTVPGYRDLEDYINRLEPFINMMVREDDPGCLIELSMVAAERFDALKEAYFAGYPGSNEASKI